MPAGAQYQAGPVDVGGKVGDEVAVVEVVVVVRLLLAPKHFLCPAAAPPTPWYGLLERPRPLAKGGARLLNLLVVVTAIRGGFGSNKF